MVLKKLLSVFTFFICVHTAVCQENSQFLIIDGEPISSEEFLKLYEKNLDLVKDESQKEIDNYLELFINYKLKLAEAKRLKLNQEASYKREFENYKKQLVKNYLSDNKVTDTLVKEAYDRMRYDLKASHILIMNDPKVEDTLMTYNTLLDYRKVLHTEGFDSAKEKFHNGTSILVEDLGYFSAFKMVYDFESMAYKTKPGEVSMPFKTQFGYHVVKIDEKRPSLGTVTAAHIMVSLEQKDSTLNPRERIREIYKRIEQGENFEDLAKQFSDDKSSSRSGGKLRPFKSGQLSSVIFEDAAFALDKEGDITQPIKTAYGWHIIKLLKKEPIKSFEAIKPTLEARVKRDARSKLINSSMAKELSKRYKIKKNTDTYSYFTAILENAYLSGKFNLPKNYDGKANVITINDSVYTNDNFLQYLKSKQRQYMRQQTTIKNILDVELDLFYETSILDFREQNLENENDEFADVLKEYRDGLLLFALMEKEIWNKASKDTLGLRKYYNDNISKYKWKDRLDVTMASTSKKDIAEKVKSDLKTGKTESEIKAKLNSNETQNVIFTSEEFELDNPKLPENLDIKIGVSEIYEHNGSFHVLKISEIIPSKQKTLEEARGTVINDYQNQIEQDWIKDLRQRFKVEVNKSVLKSLKSKISK